ncbi:MAG: hypothetical protein ACLRVQ_06735 [Lachnospiraceae bacterium]
MAGKGIEDADYEEIYNEIIREDMPVVTLDKGWHDLFLEGKSKEIDRLEKEVNNALKGQGRVRTEKEELNKLKQTLLKQIVDNMDAEENSKASKKIEKSRELIEEINDKLILIEDRALSIPNELQEANARLLMEGMEELLGKVVDNERDIENLNVLIEEARIELKKKILLREQKAEENQLISKYFNRTVGRSIVNKFERYLRGDE